MYRPNSDTPPSAVLTAPEQATTSVPTPVPGPATPEDHLQEVRAFSVLRATGQRLLVAHERALTYGRSLGDRDAKLSR
jgi:hypothetical protein